MHVHYRPAPHVLDRLTEVDFIAVVGPTAVGKTTLIAAALAKEPRLHMVRVTTSRAPRPGEQDGVDYHFRTKQEMERRIHAGEYVQVAPNLFGDYYATAPEGYPSTGPAVMAVVPSAMPMFRALPFRSFSSLFVLPPSWEEWQRRLISHNFPPDQLKRRLDETRTSLHFALHDLGTAFIINQHVDTARDEFISLALHNLSVSALRDNQQRGRALVRILLDELEKWLSEGNFSD